MKARERQEPQFDQRKRRSPEYWITEVARRGGEFYLDNGSLRLRGCTIDFKEVQEIRELSSGIIDQLDHVNLCVICSQDLPAVRVYVCESCGHYGYLDSLKPGLYKVEPRLEVYGLRIPFESSPLYHWWHNGQSSAETLRELGASEDVVSRYYNTNPGRITRSKEGEI